MATTINRLTATKVRNLKEPGYYADGAGLWLQVSGKNAKSWIFRFSLRSRAREMGLGSAHKVSLATAREERDKSNKLLRDHIDPIRWREQQRAKAVLEQTGSITFAEAARQHIASHQRGLRNAKHAMQYAKTVAVYAEPTLGKMLVADIDTPHILRVIEPIWHEKPETALRVRRRIEKILDWSKAHGYRQGDNPAAWRGNLAHLLPKQPKVGDRHLAALPYREIPAFMAELRKQDGSAARALEFLVLTAARSGELLKAQSGEIDHEERIWLVPAAHTKTAQEHRVPLCARALSLIDSQSTGRLFQIHKMSMDDLLRGMGYHGRATVHGFRSTFRDWCGDCTSYPREIAEAALSHKTGSAVELAYRRSDAFSKRDKLMQAWSDYCESVPAEPSRKVVAIRSA
jgi:integrase